MMMLFTASRIFGRALEITDCVCFGLLVGREEERGFSRGVT